MSEKVQTMFAQIAPRYDVTNSALSLGIHHLWRKVLVRLAGAKPGMSVLDCATGTGDLAITFKKEVGESGTVLGIDFCAEMLAFAPHKAEQRHLKIDFAVADVLALPYPADSFDIASIAFGIRNVDSPETCLREMARVVKPGGTVAVLEFGQPTGWFGAPYQLYSRFIMPAIGKMLTGNGEAYRYLPRTAAAFPSGERFVALMEKTHCFTEIQSVPLTFGIAYAYIGKVIAQP